MRRANGVWAAVVVAAAGLCGCVHPNTAGFPGPAGAGGMPGRSAIAVPPPGTVPTELNMVTLPPYVIESPDKLLIQVVVRAKITEKDADGKALPDPDRPGKFLERDGTKILPVQPIDNEFLLRPDGSVNLGFWGNVPLAGLTLDQAAVAIRQHVLRNDVLQRGGVREDSLVVIVDVIAYNSKRYYVITDGGGYGEQVYPFPVFGSERVLDAIANINGLPAVASRRNIWVARRCPHPNQPWQILPVDWVGITQHGLTETNYQIMPGDRVYVKAQRLVTLDTAMARVLSPVERLFGITLLGSSTVNQIQGRGTGFGNNTGN